MPIDISGNYYPDDPPKPDVTSWGGSTQITDPGADGHGPGLTHPAIQAPPPVGGGGGGGGKVSADTEAFRTVAANMATLVDPLKTAQAKLATMDVHPGAFAQAFQLKDQVAGGSGLKTSLTAVTGKLIETLTDVQNGLQKMALDYESTEDANKATAESVNALMPDLSADIQGIMAMKA